MITKKIIIILISLILISCSNLKKEKISYEVLATGLHVPWAIDFLPDGKMIFTERSGNINIFDGRNRAIIGTIKVTEVQESGLLGIAVDPDFKTNGYIYVYHTYQNDDAIWNRVSRFKLTNSLSDEKVLIDKIPSAKFHDGGRIKFGPDGKLYVTTGDATNPSSAQDINSLAGKILRINRDGSIPEDNPFKNYVYSYGHRNPQGIAWHPVTKDLFASEHGPTRNDELNIIGKGINYGWPNEECDELSLQYRNPIRCYSEFTLAPSAIAFFQNNLYVAALRGSQLRKILLGNDYKIIGEEELFTDLGRIREVVEHNGYLYISTSNRDGRGFPSFDDDKIIRIFLNE